MICESRIRNGNKRTSLSWDTNYSITEKNKEASNDLLPVLEKKYTKVLNIGTAGVDKKYGYTFKIQINIQLVQFLEQGRNLKKFHHKKINFGIMTCCY
jgi:hypothetical protein